MLTDGSAFYQLEEEIRNAFESTVLDLPRPMLVAHPHLVHEVHVAVLVVEFTLAATRDAIRIISWLKSNAPQARVVVVANKVVAGAQEISRKDFETSIERKVDILIPYDLKAAGQAAKLGQPLAKVATNAKISLPLNQLVSLTTSVVEGSEAGEVQAASGNSSLLGKLGNFKSIMSKRPKDKAVA
jgi:pilus assembly protein CpaE